MISLGEICQVQSYFTEVAVYPRHRHSQQGL